MGERYTREDRCWPCTVMNAFVGLVVAWLPLGAAVLEGHRTVVFVTVVWGVAVTAFTFYRLAARGYLPLAGTVGRMTGLHDRIGPGTGRKNRKDR